MTGRSLYDKLCMEWARQSVWARTNDLVTMFPLVPRHWSALTNGEKYALNRVAENLTRKAAA